MHLVGLRFRVEICFAGRKNEIAAGRTQELAIVRERARIPVEVFTRGKLQSIDENAGHHRAAARQRRANQRQMPFVQTAHGRHQRYIGPALKRRSHLRDVVNDLHAAKTQYPCRASSGNAPLLTSRT
jgi:hypothetical protein